MSNVSSESPIAWCKKTKSHVQKANAFDYEPSQLRKEIVLTYELLKLQCAHFFFFLLATVSGKYYGKQKLKLCVIQSPFQMRGSRRQRESDEKCSPT